MEEYVNGDVLLHEETAILKDFELTERNSAVTVSSLCL